MRRSHLLRGHVRHSRRGAVGYQLRHCVAYLALDLDELDAVTRSSVLRRGRIGLLSFSDADHWRPPATDLRAAVRQHLRDLDIDPAGWRVTLVANARVLGYVFDPASFYLCRDREGILRVLVVEVHNTYRERHLYTLFPTRRGTAHEATMGKAFHVSPFLDMDARYRVRVRDEPGRLRIAIVCEERSGTTLVATLDLRRYRLTDRGLLRWALRTPLVTHKTIAAIHAHAARLWWRGAPFRRHPGRAA
ncbi:MAG: DUF1365 domain-containing protein [Chloroflexota bacterium]